MIFVATDHAGFELKKKIGDFLKDQGYETIDLGPEKLDPTDDYPDFGFLLAQRVAAKPNSFGILLCRSGVGMSIVANKVKGIRAALCMQPKQAQKAREHNNANVLVLAADFTGFEEMKGIIRKFLETRFSGEERHRRRLEKIRKFEEEVQSD